MSEVTVIHRPGACPHCGGKGKVSFRQLYYYGQNQLGTKKIRYAAQVICNRCKARGGVAAGIVYVGMESETKEMKELEAEAVDKWNETTDEARLTATLEGEGDGQWEGEIIYDTWTCGNCGTVYETDGESPDMKFCQECGARFTRCNPEIFIDTEEED